MSSDRITTDIGAVAALGDPQRSRLYDAVRAARRPVTREEAARTVDISRKLAAFHLDKLVAYGLLEIVTEPEPGPRKVGRAPKRYRPAGRVVAVTVPRRCYETMAAVLVDVVENAERGESSQGARQQAAAGHGRQRCADIMASDRWRGVGHDGPLAFVEAVLTEEGFEAYRAGPGSVRLSNCPYDSLAARSPGLVCDLNRRYLAGLLEGLQPGSIHAVLAPAPGECCVEIIATP